MAHRLVDDEGLGAWIRRRADEPDIVADRAAHDVVRALWNVVASARVDVLFDHWPGPVLESPRVRECAQRFEQNIGKVTDREFRSACRREWKRVLAALQRAQAEGEPYWDAEPARPSTMRDYYRDYVGDPDSAEGVAWLAEQRRRRRSQV